MKKNILFFTVILLITTINMKAQNDSIYFWKSGRLILKQSIKVADLDTINFKRPAVNLPNVYICNQVWSTTNLNVSTYSDGTPIPQVTDPTAWAKLTTGAWCYLNNDPANGAIYGKLYNWYAVAGIYDTASLTNPALRKNLAPFGWHIPSNAEYSTLFNCLGGETVAGGAMKEIGTSHWPSPNVGATNTSGFTAFASGERLDNGNFLNQISSSRTVFLTSAEYTGTSASGVFLYRAGTSAQIVNAYIKKNGCSVRCIKN